MSGFIKELTVPVYSQQYNFYNLIQSMPQYKK